MEPFHAVHSEGEAQLNHPLLASSCYQIDTGELASPAFTVMERGGLRAGVIGIGATIIDKTMPEHFSTGLRFTLGNEELPDIFDACGKGSAWISSSCSRTLAFRRT